MPCLCRSADRVSGARAGRLAHDELGRQHDRLVRLVVVEQGPQQQVGRGVPLAGDVLAHRGQAEHAGEHEVVDADDRQVLGHPQPEPAGALAHPDGHLVGRGDDRRGPVRVREQLGAVAGGGLRGPVRAEDPRVVALAGRGRRRPRGTPRAGPAGSGCGRRSGGPRRCSRSSCGPGRRGGRRRCASRPCRRCARRPGRAPVNRWRRAGAPAGRRARPRSVVIGTLRVITPSTRFHSMFCERGRRWS